MLSILIKHFEVARLIFFRCVDEVQYINPTEFNYKQIVVMCLFLRINLMALYADDICLVYLTPIYLFSQCEVTEPISSQ